MAMMPAGYLTRHKWGLQGKRGSHYDFVLAGNGVFVEAEGPLLAARLQIGKADVRALAPSDTRVVLRHGRIPGHLFKLGLDVLLADPSRERYVAIVWQTNAGYQLKVPEQDRGSGGIQNIALPENRVFEMHSHPGMGAYFSGTDNQDEQGFQIFGVVGWDPDEERPRVISEYPQVLLRVGLYGYFEELAWAKVFSGVLEGASDKSLEEKPWL
jgi:hypothetical protein